MKGPCSECEYFEEQEGRSYGSCTFTPPATIADALGLSSQHEFRDADTHRDWTCSLFTRR